MPSEPRMTASTSRLPVTQITTASASAAIARALVASRAPRPRRSSTGARLRCARTRRSLPFVRMFFAMPCPISPRPMKPTSRFAMELLPSARAPPRRRAVNSGGAHQIEAAAPGLVAVDDGRPFPESAAGGALLLCCHRQPLHRDLVAGHRIGALGEHFIGLDEARRELTALETGDENAVRRCPLAVHPRAPSHRWQHLAGGEQKAGERERSSGVSG